jgi:hypothetical protein
MIGRLLGRSKGTGAPTLTINLMTRIVHSSLRALIVTLCLFRPAGSALAQDPDVRIRMAVPDSTHLQVVTLSDGSKIIGRIVSVTADTVTFQTRAGTMQLSAVAIREIKEFATTDLREGEYWFPNPNSTRLFFAPSGQMLKQGEGYFSDYLLVFPGMAYGVTDNFTIGGGISLLPAKAEDQIYYLTPKIGFSVTDKIHLAAGMLLAGTQGGTGGVYYGVGTFGDGNASVTLGGGYGFAGGKIQQKPVAMAGGELRVSQRVGIVTENYLLPTADNVLYSFGLRFMGENITTDLALVNTAGSGIIGVPFVDFVVRF